MPQIKNFFQSKAKLIFRGGLEMSTVQVDKGFVYWQYPHGCKENLLSPEGPPAPFASGPLQYTYAPYVRVSSIQLDGHSQPLFASAAST